MKNQSRQGIAMRGAYRRARLTMKIGMQGKGRAVLQVLDPDQSVVSETAADNLVLNSGLDMVRTRPWVENFAYCVLGTASTPTADAGGVTTAAQAGTTVTLTGGSFTFTDTGTDTGKTIKWGSGATARIVTVTDPTHAEVMETQTVGAGSFTVYRTNQTAATMTEVQRTNNYVTTGGGCGSSLAGNVLSHKRTFDFPAEVGTVTYREVGFSHSGTAATDIFSRIKLPTDLVVVTGQVVRVVYTFELTITPDSPVAKAADIVGWPIAPATDTEGDEAIQRIGLSGINAGTGASEVGVSGKSLEPSAVGVDCSLFLSDISTALAAFGSSVDRTSVNNYVAALAIDNDTVTAGVGSLEKYVLIPVEDANATHWRSMGFGTNTGGVFPYVVSGFVFVFDQAQTKDNLHTLEVRFLFTWNPTLA